MATEEKKGITVKIDAALHAEVRQYIEQHGMTMAEFVALALENELHPKFQQEEKKMENMRTLAFQVPESLFQQIKGYLQRNNMTQKQFVIGLIETELDREQNEREGMDEDQEESTAEVCGEDTEEAAEENVEAAAKDAAEEATKVNAVTVEEIEEESMEEAAEAECISGMAGTSDDAEINEESEDYLVEESADEVESDLEEENDMAAENAEEVSGDRDQEDTDIAEDEEMEADSSDEAFDTEDEEAEGLSMCM